jgi:hypothetical protein
MSTSIATSPDSGHSRPCTPHRDQASSVQPAKSSPVGKLYKYYLPKNRKQYQKFGHDVRFLLGAFDRLEFLEFLNVNLPESVPDMGSGGKDSFLLLANKVAKFIKTKGEHCLFLYLGFLPTYDFHFRFPKPRYPSVLGHGKQITTWTRYGHNVQA